jgi:hypothetical protein
MSVKQVPSFTIDSCPSNKKEMRERGKKKKKLWV